MTIKVVLFDMGGTIENLNYDHASRIVATKELLAFLKSEHLAVDADPETLLQQIERACKDYRAESERTMREAPAAEVWSRWYLRDYRLPQAEIGRMAEDLAWIWETRFYTRTIRPGASEAFAALKERGFRLGIISNTSSRTQVFRMLESYGIREFFECVCLSSISGIRKPDPAIFREGLDLLGVRREEAAYVGDTISRDIAGAKAAGYALAFQIHSFLTKDRDGGLEGSLPGPDYMIQDLREIAGILDRISTAALPA